MGFVQALAQGTSFLLLQGCSLSPLLNVIFMDRISRHCCPSGTITVLDYWISTSKSKVLGYRLGKDGMLSSVEMGESIPGKGDRFTSDG